MKPLHLIIDGSDNLGKTTVLKILSEELGLPVIKMPNMGEYIKKNSPEEFSKLFNETIIQFKEHSFLLDRGYTSSLVYSKVFGRQFRLSYIDYIEKELDPVVIILTGRYTDPLSQKTRYRSFCEDPIFSENDKAEIDIQFCNLAKKMNYPLIEVMGKTPFEVSREILSYAKK